MIDTNEIKKIANKFGADLCGIASIDRFENAPIGFHPKDIFPENQSIISIACKTLESTIDLTNPIPYSTVENIILGKVQSIAVSICLEIENRGNIAFIMPSAPYDYWDNEKMEARGLLSLKHIGYYAGIAIIGKNSLLCNQQFGNLIRLGAILTDLKLEPDTIPNELFCLDNCNLCITNCPVGAIDNNFHVNQKKCRLNSEGINKRGVEITVCNNCRKVCPYRSGYKKRN